MHSSLAPKSTLMCRWLPWWLIHFTIAYMLFLQGLYGKGVQDCRCCLSMDPICHEVFCHGQCKRMFSPAVKCQHHVECKIRNAHALLAYHSARPAGLFISSVVRAAHSMDTAPTVPEHICLKYCSRHSCCHLKCRTYYCTVLLCLNK